MKKINISQNKILKKYKFHHIADALSSIPQEM
jgi:hypothetical protein